uniref:RRM domain-containing protein n=1 Tax=Caenorhabditis tropicalis TaxID=1561998 RepID=A0A1I7TAC9_9PELO
MSTSSKFESEIEEESKILKEIQNEMVESMEKKTISPSEEDQKEIDARSVFVGNVDFNATIEELEEHFKGCGMIVRCTIPKDKYTRKQKNIAFIEFESAESLENALAMSGSMFRNRKIVVTSKRTNRPGMGVQRGGKRVIVKYVYGQTPRGKFSPY